MKSLFDVPKKPIAEKRDLKGMRDELLSIDCWLNTLYNKAYSAVKTDLYPIVIPSYCRPASQLLKYISDYMTDDFPYFIYVVVRKSQEVDYLSSIYIKDKPYIQVVSFPDEEIDDLGKVRKKIVEYFSERFDNIFMLDDDLYNIVHIVPYFMPNGAPKSQKVLYTNFGKVMAMWQLAHSIAVKKFNIFISCPLLLGFSWTPECSMENRSIKLFSGAQGGAVCLNVKLLKETGLNYVQLKGNGHEDRNLLIRALQKGLVPAEFRWLSFDTTTIGSKSTIGGNSSVAERYKQQHDEMMALFGTIPFVKSCIVRGNYDIRIDWKICKEYFKFHHLGTWPKDTNYNIWQDCKKELKETVE